MKKKIGVSLIILLIVMQFFPINTENPTSDSKADFLTISGIEGKSEATLIKDACYDCHSNQTIYPAYTRIQPLGFYLRSHIRGGRQKLNFSTWTDYPTKKQIHKLEECVEVLEDRRMPLKSYTWLHPKSKLSEVDRQSLIAFFSKS